MRQSSHVLFVDAYDSFAGNIVALIRQLLKTQVTVIRIDTDLQDAVSFFTNFDAVVLGPGPGNPTHRQDTGLFDLVWKVAAQENLPVLGICLGFQSLCATFGLSISRLDLPCHGHAKQILHRNQDIFSDVGTVFATCYNSLGVRLTSLNITPATSRPPSSSSSSTTYSNSSTALLRAHPIGESGKGKEASISVLANDEDGFVMASKHITLPFWGIQFHPESCKSNEGCKILLQNWWNLVLEHNGKHRPGVRLPSTPMSRGSIVMDVVQPSLLSGRTLDCLQALLGKTSKAVQCQKLSMICGRQQMADLSHSLSHSESMAMLESTKRGRFSIYTFSDHSNWHLGYSDSTLIVSRNGTTLAADVINLHCAMELLEDCLVGNIVTEGDPDIPFWGGLVGFFSYEAGLDLLEVSTIDDHTLRDVPDFSLISVDRSIVVDHQEHTVSIQSVRQDDEVWVETMTSRLKSLHVNKPSDRHSTSLPKTTLVDLPSRTTYISKIRSCKASLHVGDSYELCLTTSSTLTSRTDSYHLYTSLQSSNPAPYSAYLSLGDTTILSSSPEQFLTWSRTTPHLDMMPMKGTLAKTPSITTLAHARTLLLTPKEEAENLMIVDLIRHDLHSALGSDGQVSVEKLFEVVETETLFQLISHVRGHIPLPLPVRIPSSSASPPPTTHTQAHVISRAGHNALRHALPAGSMTGAPKKRSCEILRNLEGRNRGVYSGVIGYFDIGGGGAWSVAIRCAYSTERGDDERRAEKDDDHESREASVRDRTWHVGAGGAITVLSDDEMEWDEMSAKMQSVSGGFGVRVSMNEEMNPVHEADG